MRVGVPQPATSQQTAINNARIVKRICHRGLGRFVVARPIRGKIVSRLPLVGGARVRRQAVRVQGRIPLSGRQVTRENRIRRRSTPPTSLQPHHLKFVTALAT